MKSAVCLLRSSRIRRSSRRQIGGRMGLVSLGASKGMHMTPFSIAKPPDELKGVLNEPSNRPILFARENANYYVNLLWLLGLANYMPSNMQSPINKLNPIKGQSLFDFASTGGWNLGKEVNGGAYFNKFKIVELTPDRKH